MKHLIIFSILLLSISLHSQDTLCGPHNGAIQKSGKFYVELANCGNDVEVFVYNQLKRPVSTSVITNAEIEFAYLDETFWTIPLLPGTCNNLQARIPDKNFYKSRVSFHIGIAIITAYFDNELLLLTLKPDSKK
ncbi:MAG: hypothetical protein ACXVO9_05730 [Bacteroidia bacterium]